MTEPKAKPISFTRDMALAVHEGRKTQTRRVLRLPSWASKLGSPDEILNAVDVSGSVYWLDPETGKSPRLPLNEPGDLLWVREPYWQMGKWEYSFNKRTKTGRKKKVFLPAGYPVFEKPDEEILSISHVSQMGWPIGHALCACSETESTRWRLQSRSALSDMPLASARWIFEEKPEPKEVQGELF